MALAQDISSRISTLDQKVGGYIPPRDGWNPVDEAVFRPVDLYQVPIDEAEHMQLKAIRYSFLHHYTNNKFYHKYCRQEDVRPDDIKTVDDFDQIPLIPDATFKQYPSGKDFARWLATIFTGDLPRIVIKGDPKFDVVINAFNTAGLAVTYSSGTSGLLSVMPRDTKTFSTARYCWAKSATNMMNFFVDHALMCFPKPGKTNLFMAVATSIVGELSNKVHYAFDIDVPAELTQRAMSRDASSRGKAISSSQRDVLQKIIGQVI
jgi:hypothetical protein